MKEIIKDLFLDWPIGTILGILLSACIIVLIGTISYPLFIAHDSSNLPEQTSKGYVVEKSFTPAHTSFVPIFTGKVTTLMPIQHSDKWDLTITINNESASVSVTKSFYDSCSKDDEVGITFVKGRSSGNIYIKSVWK